MWSLLTNYFIAEMYGYLESSALSDYTYDDDDDDDDNAKISQ